MPVAVRGLLAAGSALLLAAPALAQERVSVTATAGVDYSSGKYGAEEATDLLVVPLSLRVSGRGINVTASLPYLRIDSPGGVVVGPGGEPIPGVPTAPGIRQGFGDFSLGLSYDIPPGWLGDTELSFGGRVKFPTSAKSRQLGTGKTDYNVSAEISYPLGDWSPFLGIGYRMPGEPEGASFRNSLTATAGTSLALGRSVLILSYDYAGASSRLAEDSHELFGALSGPISSRLTLTGYGVLGLSEGSPDFGVGLLVTAKLTAPEE